MVTTNSITQSFQRRVLEKHLRAIDPISIVTAIPDHPWTKATSDAAAVRIAMTVAQAGRVDGLLFGVCHEDALDSDAPVITLTKHVGTINSNLTIGTDVTSATALMANRGICSTGVKLHGSGFIITPQQCSYLGLGGRRGLESHVREYRNGRDLTDRPRGVKVIDLFGLSAENVKNRFPEVYQHLLLSVKPERDKNNRAAYRENWWIFGEPRGEFRPALIGLPRYVVTATIAKHRIFQFLDGVILPDVRLVCFASDDALLLGTLSSRAHMVWAEATGATLEDRPTYITSRCFDPFPFPAPSEALSRVIRSIAGDLDAHRKRILAEHPHLTLTGLYNVLEKLRAGTDPAALSVPDRRIFDDGLVLILKEFHDHLDAAVAEAYGWPADLSDNDILARLVALNRERAQEEARGLVRWLRPDYQIPRFGSAQQKAELVLEGGAMHAAQTEPAQGPKPAFPADDTAQTAAVMAALASAPAPLDATSLAARFRQGRRVAPKVGSVLGALQRMGFVSSADAGHTWSLRRVA